MAVTWEEITDPPILDSTGQDILEALGNIKDVLQPTNVGVDMPVSIPVSAWPNSAPYEFTWLSNKVTPECVVSVGYGEGAENIDTLYLYATKVAGGVKFTAPEKPAVAIPVVVHILNASAESVTASDADMVATSAVSGASNVDQALGVLANTKQNATDNSLTTTAKTVVGAINEHDAEIGDLSNLTTIEDGSLVGAVNELNGDIANLEAYTFGTAVNITSYTTSSNRYTFPSDGYVRIRSGNTLNDACEITINKFVELMAKCQVQNYAETNSIFVKKGMDIYVNQNTGGRGTVHFIPLQ